MLKRQSSPEIYLHVGLHKTGTSAIQRMLAINRLDLLDEGIFYPDPDCLDAHHLTVNGILSSNEYKDAGEALFRKNVTNWINEAREHDARYLLISSEMFSEHVTTDYLKTLANDYHVRVIIYLRRQDYMVESTYGQVLKQNGLVIPDPATAPPYNINYWAHLNFWIDVVGDDNLVIKIYDQVTQSPLSLEQGFLGIFSVRDDINLKVAENVVNESLGLREAKLLESIAPVFGDDFSRNIPKLRERIKLALQGDDVPMVGNYLSHHERQAIMQRVAESNDKVQRRFFPEQESLFEPVVDRDGVRITELDWADIVYRELFDK